MSSTTRRWARLSRVRRSAAPSNAAAGVGAIGLMSVPLTLHAVVAVKRERDQRMCPAGHDRNSLWGDGLIGGTASLGRRSRDSGRPVLESQYVGTGGCSVSLRGAGGCSISRRGTDGARPSARRRQIT